MPATAARDCSKWRMALGPNWASFSDASDQGWAMSTSLVRRAIAAVASRQPPPRHAVRDEDVGEDRVLHQRDDVGLVAHVVVERHRRRAEFGGDPLHRDRVESLLVRDPQRGGGDLLAGVARLAVGRLGQGPDGAVVVLRLPLVQHTNKLFVSRTNSGRDGEGIDENQPGSRRHLRDGLHRPGPR